MPSVLPFMALYQDPKGQCKSCMAQVPKSVEGLDIMELTLVFDLTWGNLWVLLFSPGCSVEEGMRPRRVKPVNFDKGKWLKERMKIQLSLEPLQRSSGRGFPEVCSYRPHFSGRAVIAGCVFILQSIAKIRRKLQKALTGSPTPMNQLLNMAFAI